MVRWVVIMGWYNVEVVGVLGYKWVFYESQRRLFGRGLK
jgi:hypothetical protein